MGWVPAMVGVAGRLLAAWLLLAGACLARDAPASASLVVRFGGDGASTRVVLDLDAAPAGRVTARQDGARLIIDLPNAPAAGGGQGQGHGLVGAWSLAPSAAGSRLSLDLNGVVSVTRRFLIPPSVDVGHWRYVVDLAAVDPLASLAADPPAPAASAVIAPRLPPRLASLEPLGPPKVIVVDPGHGGHDTGAQSPDHNEKDVTLAAGLALKARLERSGRYHVVLTRADDTFIPLPERVRIARAAHADLFISLHADSAGADPGPHGASVYTVSDHGVTRVNEVVGPHDLFTRLGDRRADPAVGQILLDLSQRATRNRSVEFAGLLIDHIGQSIDVLAQGHRDASYFVLLAPDVPAVLMEMGFITNPGDEQRLTDADQRRRLMDKVGDAIDDYFAPRREVALR